MSTQLIDEITDITFRNEDNGYSVLRLKQNGTATGIFAFVSIGQELNMTGEWINNAKFGKQFKVTNYTVMTPNTPTKIKQFIGSGLIKGIGPVTADRIVATFGKDTLRIMDQEPLKLSRVKGISRDKAKDFGIRYTQVKLMQDSIIFLSRFNISINMAVKIFKKFGESTISTVSHNPYILIEKISGIGFLTADKMAMDLGVAYNGNFRVRAGLVHILKTASDLDGHTFLPRNELLIDACKLLKIKQPQLEPVFDDVTAELCMDKLLTMVKKEGDIGFMLTKLYNDERAIAGRLNSLITMINNKDDDDLDELVEHYEKLNNIQLHDMQREAVKAATKHGFCVITGGPGTGKTTIVKAILYINQAKGHTTKLLSPTGRAAKRLEDTTGQPASTIHRAMLQEKEEQIDCDMIIVDEVSMCDVSLTATMLKSISPRTRVVFVGDVDQLPSVGAGAVLSDIIQSGIVPVTRLTEIYRQVETSGIVLNAHAINKGDMPDLTNKSADFFFKRADTLSKIKSEVISLATTRIPKFLDITPDAVQILCPIKAGEVGMNNLNIVLQDALNPPMLEKSEYEYGNIIFRVGDRVMQTVNNYSQEWQRGFENGSGVYNGDIGIITGVNRQNGEVVVTMEDGRTVTYVRSDLNNLVLAYAITVHKSQGSEFDVVIIPVTSGAYMILTRNLLYTAVTRAKKMVVLVGDESNIEKMVRNTYTKKRHTMLAEFLVKMNNILTDICIM